MFDCLDDVQALWLYNRSNIYRGAKGAKFAKLNKLEKRDFFTSWNSSRVVTCREPWSIETRIGKEKEEGKKEGRGEEKKKGKKEKTIVDDERASPPCWLVAASRKFPEISRFSRRVDTLFKIFSKFFVHGNVFTLPQPPTYDPPYTRSREKNRVRKIFFLHFSHFAIGNENDFFFFSNNDRVEFIGIILARKKNSILLNVKERTKEKTRIIRT